MGTIVQIEPINHLLKIPPFFGTLRLASFHDFAQKTPVFRPNPPIVPQFPLHLESAKLPIVETGGDSGSPGGIRLQHAKTGQILVKRGNDPIFGIFVFVFVVAVVNIDNFGSIGSIGSMGSMGSMGSVGSTFLRFFACRAFLAASRQTLHRVVPRESHDYHFSQVAAAAVLHDSTQNRGERAAETQKHKAGVRHLRGEPPLRMVDWPKYPRKIVWQKPAVFLHLLQIPVRIERQRSRQHAPHAAALRLTEHLRFMEFQKKALFHRRDRTRLSPSRSEWTFEWPKSGRFYRYQLSCVSSSKASFGSNPLSVPWHVYFLPPIFGMTEIGSTWVQSKNARKTALTACSMIWERLKPSWHTGITRSDFCNANGIRSTKKETIFGIPENEAGSKSSEPPASTNWFITSSSGVGLSTSCEWGKRGNRTSNWLVDQKSADFWMSWAKEVGSAQNSIDFASMKRSSGVTAMRFNRGSVEPESFWAFLRSKWRNGETGGRREDRVRWDASACFPPMKCTLKTWKQGKPMNQKVEPEEKKKQHPNNAVKRGNNSSGDAISEIRKRQRLVLHSNFLRYIRGKQRPLHRSRRKRRSSIPCNKQCVEETRSRVCEGNEGRNWVQNRDIGWVKLWFARRWDLISKR